MRRALLICVAAALAMAGLVPAASAEAAQPRSTASACPAAATSDPWFWDMRAGAPFADSIACLRYWQVTSGLADGSYRPTGYVTRGELATFLTRAIQRSGGKLPAASKDYFRDDTGSAHQGSLNALAQAGVMQGTGRGTAAPRQPITRLQMAALVVRAHDYRAKQAGAAVLGKGRDAFSDDDGYALEAEVNKAAAAGIVAGTGTARFSPRAAVRRDHMAAFLTRLLDTHVDAKVASVPAAPPAAKRPVAPKPAPKPAPPATQSVLTSLEQAVFNEINAYRKSKGLRALAADACLTKAARAWSGKLVRDGGLSHGGSTCGNRSWAENVAYTYNPGEFFELWRDSPGHNRNLLRSGATKMGVGIASVKDQYGTRYYATTQSD